jgi:phage shock protein A
MESAMSKSFWTLLRGAVHAAEQDAIDRSALLILDQHIRDAAAGIERAKRALAVAIAQDEAEGKRLASTLARIADLEERAAAALAAGRQELATEAAEAIAMMEADRDAIREARALFAKEIGRLRREVAGASHRLNELERGRRIAHAAEAVRRLRSGGVLPDHGAIGLAEAEATLRRLRERQAEEAAADAALQTLDAGTAGNSIADRLEAEGFGRRTRPTAASVLERLRQRQAEAAKPEATKPEPPATLSNPVVNPEPVS